MGTFRFKELGDFGLAVITSEGAIEIVKVYLLLNCLILLDEILSPEIRYVKSSTE